MKNETPVQSFGSRGVMSRKQVWKVIGLSLLVCGSLHAQRITSFDAPVPPGTGPTQGTFPTAINLAGVIVGSVSDASGVYHGFVRSRDGTTITPFDPPGSANTIVTGITPEGKITGYYTDAFGVNHGFLRASNGKFTNPIDDPLAGIQSGEGTFPLGINPAGEITGYYYDTLFVNHGFLRTPGGTFTEFDPPTSLGTTPEAINPRGEIMGIYVSADPVSGLTQVHVFLRTTNGTLTIDPPGLVSANQSDSAGYGGASVVIPNADGAINPAGSVVGFFADSSGYQGFLRTSNGTITPINEPNSANSAHWTYVNAINPSGTIIGTYLDNTASSTAHGFVRDPKGNYTTIDGPNSPLPPFSTSATAINPVGEITGYYEDASFVTHGFVRIPAHKMNDTEGFGGSD
jgi:hypothetical protein